MSAIFGVIDFNTSKRCIDIEQGFRLGYEGYKIDRLEYKDSHGAGFGCGVQYFTKEARDEILPIVDETHNQIFTADCLLDNRQELLKELGLTDVSLPDGTILYQAYLKWGKECVNYVRGVFSFVVYNWEKKVAELYADHFANRCLFYHLREGVLYFSTLLFPLLKASDLDFRENERWLVDSISLRSPAIVIEPRETALEGIYKVDSGHMVSVTAEAAEYHTYWNPIETIPTNTKMKSEECERLVRECMKKSVSETLRTDGEVAIKLSCGLDSSTVACIAAPMLEAQGKKLYSYTSVPLEKKERKGYYIDDETEGVLKICKEYPNIIPEFVRCEEENILTEAERLVDIWEMPCKSEQNAVWTAAISREAAKRECKILLSGATGNCTISAGRIEDYLMYHVFHFHWIRAYKDFHNFFDKYKGNKKIFAKNLCKAILKHQIRFLDKTQKDFYGDNITRKDIGERYQLTKRFYNEVYNFGPIKTMKNMREEIYLSKAYAQIGEIDTKYSLTYGVLERDPMRNVQFIELCMSLPMECYVNGEYDRRLVREFMHGIVPDEIRLDVRHRGRQSADNAERIAMSWEQMLPAMKKALYAKEMLHYLDKQKIEEYLSGLNRDNLKEKEMDMRMIVDAYVMSLFLRRINGTE